MKHIFHDTRYKRHDNWVRWSFLDSLSLWSITSKSQSANVMYGTELSSNIKKVKCAPVQAMRLCTGRTVHRGSRSIALLFLDHGTRRGEGSTSRPGRYFPPGKTRYTLNRRLGGSQGRSGQVRKISPPPGFDPRTVQPVASRYTDWATRPTSSNIRCSYLGWF